MSKKPIDHSEHWLEPTAVTYERAKDQKQCESCGEDIPWHGPSCAMLKNAYKRRMSKCSFCSEKHFVGDLMRAHVEEQHQIQLMVLLNGS
jgi:predicted amidophosphoribosyltransferase